jgi:hypothetical protein
MENNPEYQRAKRKVKSIRTFYVHLSIFILVMTFLVVLNVGTGGVWWFQWVFIGWGIGVAAHALAVFGLGGWLGADWEDKKIKEIMSRKSGQ